jgi:hypothetical protein
VVEWYDDGHDGPPRVCRIQLHCTDTLQLQILGSGTMMATTAPLVFVEYSYHSQELAAVRCRYNVVVFYKHEGGRRGRDRTIPKSLQL